MAAEKLDYLVIVTNSTFSNPTRDWVKQWQARHPYPKVKLWDRTQLERFLSRHPAVVLRLFSQALSMQGRLQALEARFWNKLEYSNPTALREFWENKEKIEFNPLPAFALTANEFANGSIGRRAWAAIFETDDLLNVMAIDLINVPYLIMRASTAGAEQRPIIRALAYIILALWDKMPAEDVAQMVMTFITRGEDARFPEELVQILLMPIMDQMLSEIQDVCSSDCHRIMALRIRAFLENEDEVDEYWRRFERNEGVRTRQI